MASSSTSVKKYHVFISFRGADTRKGFTSILYSALCDKRIETFIDEDDLEKGDEISTVLLGSIEASAISIIVFSENYANSRWCLDELNHIVHCKETKGQLVLPVFYHVDPTNIRHQRGSFGAAFSQHEIRFGHDPEKLVQWRKSLTTTADLSGWDSAEAKSEADLVKKIVKFVTEKLQDRVLSIDYMKGLIGIENNMQKIESELCIGSTNKGTRIVGIWGMGGIGKTTLARALFEKSSSRFSGSSFLENVSEEVKKHQPSDLQKRVYSELLNEKDLVRVTDFDKQRLSGANVLLVLDNVDHVKQLDFLAKDRSWFGPGSRIVVTSRDSQVLRNIAADEICEVEELSFGDALQLFLSKAFRGEEESPAEGYSELAVTMVKKYAKGNPLALTVLGRYLCSKSIEEWKSEMELLDSTPNQEIQDILRASYEGLSQNHRDMFLDIACFFNGEYRNSMQRKLGYRYKGVVMGISVFVDKALVTVNDHKQIWMHNLIKEMGQEIVSQQSIDPGERNRLWSTSDICHVLEENQGTQKIQGIFLSYTSTSETTYHLTIFNCDPLVFKEMRNLWFLHIDPSYKSKLLFPDNLDFLPATLRYFQWNYCPLSSLPQSFSPKNLCEVVIRGKNLERVWNHKYKDLQKLEVLNLSGCSNLNQLPDLSYASNLEYLNLDNCSKLNQLSDLSRNSNLKHLSLSGCCNLDQLPGLSRSSNLEYVNLTTCSKLGQLLDLSQNSNLKHLNLSGCSNLSQLTDLSRSSNLEYLNLTTCSNLSELPDLSCNSNIKYLNLSGCSNLSQLQDIPHTSNLVYLNLTNCSNLSQLSDLFRNSNLKHLILSGCSNLSQLPKLSHNSNLEYLNLTKCRNLSQLSDFSPNSNLKYLNVSGCTNLSQLPDLSCSSNIEYLNLTNCINLTQLPDLSRNSYLKHFNLSGCSNLSQLPDLSRNSNLEYLNLTNCINMSQFSDLSHNSNLKYLNFSGCCRNLSHLPDLSRSSNLEYLNVTTCSNLSQLPDLSHNSNLKHLNLSGCSNLSQLPDLSCISNLEYLNLTACGNLTQLPDLSRNSNLKHLNISGCSNLTQLMDLSYNTNLESLNLTNCINLSQIPDLSRNLNLKRLDLTNCSNLSQELSRDLNL